MLLFCSLLVDNFFIVWVGARFLVHWLTSHKEQELMLSSLTDELSQRFFNTLTQKPEQAFTLEKYCPFADNEKKVPYHCSIDLPTVCGRVLASK
jgi:hypothetical protein